MRTRFARSCRGDAGVSDLRQSVALVGPVLLASGATVAETPRAIERRAQPRFQMVGSLSGRLEVARPLRVINIGSGGALIESTRNWPIGSVHPVVIADDVTIGRARLVVKHVRKLEGATSRFMIGVEFLSLSPELAAAIVQWIGAEPGD